MRINTAAIDYVRRNAALLHNGFFKWYRHLMSCLNIVRLGVPDDHYRDREFSEYFGRLTGPLHLLSRLRQLFIQLLFLAGEKLHASTRLLLDLFVAS